jgi:hypothetical protein
VVSHMATPADRQSHPQRALWPYWMAVEWTTIAARQATKVSWRSTTTLHVALELQLNKLSSRTWGTATSNLGMEPATGMARSLVPSSATVWALPQTRQLPRRQGKINAGRSDYPVA